MEAGIKLTLSFLWHIFSGFRGLQRIQKIEKKKIVKNPENYCQSVFLECIHQNVFFKCICRDIELYFWGQKSLGFGVNTKKIIMMFGIIIKGILMMLVFIIMTDVGIISICTDIMITDQSHTLISHPLFWYWYGCSHFRKGRQAKFWQTLLRAGKIPKNIFKNLEKYWWDLKKRGGSLLKFREEKSEKKYWKPGTILEISGRTYNLKKNT